MVSLEERVSKLEESVNIWINDGHRFEVKSNLGTFYADKIRVLPGGRIDWWCDDGGIKAKRTLLRMTGDVIVTDYNEDKRGGV